MYEFANCGAGLSSATREFTELAAMPMFHLFSGKFVASEFWSSLNNWSGRPSCAAIRQARSTPVPERTPVLALKVPTLPLPVLIATVSTPFGASCLRAAALGLPITGSQADPIGFRQGEVQVGIASATVEPAARTEVGMRESAWRTKPDVLAASR